MDLNLFIFFYIGACLGSFANVVIYRWPQGKSIVSPRSHCYQCQKNIAWYDNIPLVSWLLLRGKCRNCQTPISFRYWLVEFLTASLFVITYLKFGVSFTSIEICLLSFGLVTISFIDLDHFLIPDLFSLTGIVLGLVGAYFNPDRSFLSSLGGVLMGGGFLWAIAYLYFVFKKQEGLGGGDIKLIAWMGAVLGWKSIPFIILFASFFGTLVGLGIMAYKKQGLKTAIPFGPYLSVAGLVYVFLGESLGSWYLGLFIPEL